MAKPSRYSKHKRDGYIRNHAFDYAYLSKIWNLKHEKPFCRWYINVEGSLEIDPLFDEDIEAIKEFLNTVSNEHFETCEGWSHGCICRMKGVARDLRVYLRHLGNNRLTYESRVWKAMSKIKNDYSLIRIFYPLVGYAWD